MPPPSAYERVEPEGGSLTGRHQRQRAAFLSPLWRKAPFALVHYPGLLASVVVGALLLALVAAAFPLFLSRSEAQLLRTGIEDPTISAYGAGMFYSVTNVRLRERVSDQDDDLLRDRLDETFGELAERGPHLGEPVRYVLGPVAEVTRPGGIQAETGPVEGRLVSGTSAERNVEIVSGSPDGDGAVVPDLIADTLEVGPGDTIEVGRKIPLRIAAVYKALFAEARIDYWLPWSEQIYRECADCRAPPQFILIGEEELEGFSRELGSREIDLGWAAPLDGLPLTLDEAREVSAYTRDVVDEATRPRSELGRLLRCCGTTFGGFFFGRRDIEFRSSMPLVIREVERRGATVEGPLRLLLIAGLGVAAAVVAAAAAFAVAGRRTEAALLHARGWGPGRFAVRSGLEALWPTALGAAAGLASAWWLISTFGPAAPAAASARSASLMAAAAAGAAALIVLAAVSAVSFFRTFEVHALRRRFAWIPYEVLAIAGALWILSRLNAGGALIEDPRLDIQRPSSLLLAFPVLFVAGFATLAARLVVEALRRAGASLSGSSPTRYLAVHRLTGLPRLTVLLVAASALCLGVFVNAQTMVRSLRATVDAKAGVFVGGDVAVRVDYTAPEQERFPLPITRSTRLKYAGELRPGDVPFDILGIDAATIADAAFWDASFADEPLEDLVAPLRSEPDDGPLPVLLVQGGSDPSSIRTAQVELPVRVVGHADAFPGVSSDDPVIVVDRSSFLARVGPQGNPFLSANARTEYWINGDTQEALAAVNQLEAFPLDSVTAEEVKDVPFIAAALDTFAMLNVLGLAAALLVIGVLIVYLQARQRARTVSNVLSIRMGMRDRQAMLALVLELAVVLVLAFLLGASFGMLAGRLVAPLLDPLQTIPPAPLFEMPLDAVAWTLAGLLLVAAIGGWLVHRRSAAVDLGEVLRVAE